MVDCTIRTLPGGAEEALSLPGVPSVGCWVETPAAVVVVDCVFFRAAGPVLLVGHPVAAVLVGERLTAPAAPAEPDFQLQG